MTKNKRARDDNKSDDLFRSVQRARRSRDVHNVLGQSFLVTIMVLISSLMPACLASIGNKDLEKNQTRVDFKDIANQMTRSAFKRMYRMKKASFFKLHTKLESELKKIFIDPNTTRNPTNSNYTISTENRLSMALRFFAGGDPYDILLVHHVSYKSVYLLVWGVVDAINNTKEFEIQFPSHKDQEEIAKGFRMRSGAGF